MADTLVCIFLRGGADTLNMVVPYADDDYYKMRPTIAIAKPGTQTNDKACLKLDDFYGLHPEMKALLPSFRDGRLTVVQAVGTDNTSGSHFEAQDQMEHGSSMHSSAGGGWLGRYLKSLKEPMSPLSAVAIGSSVPESLRGAPSVGALRSIDEVKLNVPPGAYERAITALQSLYSNETGIIRDAGMDTLNLMSRVKSIQGKEYKPAQGAEYGEDDFGRGLREVARLIKAEVGMRVACVDLPGWDTHFVQGSNEGLQAGLIKQFADGLGAFDRDMRDMRSHVHVLVITEFGRRTYENSSLGTDHGRGFAAFVLSDKLKGGKVVGKYPGLAEAPAETILGPSGLSVMHDYRSLLSELLSTLMGSQASPSVFPGLKEHKVGLEPA